MRKICLLICCFVAGCSGRSTPFPEASPTNQPGFPTVESTGVVLSDDMPDGGGVSVITTPAGLSTPALTPANQSYGPRYFPSGIDPLTGLAVDDPGLLERRPLAIKITDFPRGVRPQWGLNVADQVYEYYIGDNMSRFIGIFYGKNASRVGPVRSGRLFDEHIMRMYHAIFVFAYADFRVRERLFVDDLKPYLVIETPTNCPPICRYETNMAYNNLYVDTQKLSEYIVRRGTNNDRQDLTGYYFESDPPKSGQPGTKLSIRYTYASYNRWEYDPLIGRYLRWEDTVDNLGANKAGYNPLIDSSTISQVAADNLLVLLLPHETFYKSSSTEILDIVLKGPGQGYAFRDGRVYPIRWDQTRSDRQLTLTLPDGRLYPLKPGNVWFEILGKSSLLYQEANANWRFEFRVP